MWRYISKTLIIVTSLLMIVSCDDIPRDNVLDPKNPDSYRAQLLLADVFVNTQNDQQFNEWMLQAVDSLQSLFGARIIVAEHHRNTSNFSDPLHLDASEVLYSALVGLNGGGKGVPDVFINNGEARVKGASSVSSALLRLQTAVQPLISNTSEFTIEPTLTLANSSLDASVKLAKLGNASASDLKIRMMILENTGTPLQYRVVKRIMYSNVIRSLDHGDVTTVRFDPVTINWSGELSVVFAISSVDERIIYQTVQESMP